MSTTEILTWADCIDGIAGCGGNIEYRMALSATGESFARCDKHWDVRLDEQERIDRDYPDSPCAPDWFDPMDAGEHWDEDY